MRIFSANWGLAVAMDRSTLTSFSILPLSQAHRTYDRQKGVGANFPVAGVMATATRPRPLIGRRSFELQQLV